MDDRPDTPGAEPDSKRDRDARARLVEALPRLRAALATLGAQGLQRMSAASVAELQALQQTAHFAGLVTVARHLDALATHLQATRSGLERVLSQVADDHVRQLVGNGEVMDAREETVYATVEDADGDVIDEGPASSDEG